MGSIMGRKRSERNTILSEWLARNQDRISRDDFALRLGVRRQHVDRHARGDQRPALDLAFDIEDLTKQVTAGQDVLSARAWWLPPGQRVKTVAKPAKARLASKK